MALNLSDITKEYASKYGITLKDAATICKSVFCVLDKLLFDDGKDITIYGHFAFKQVKHRAKACKHPKTGEMVSVPTRSSVKIIKSQPRQNSEEILL